MMIKTREDKADKKIRDKRLRAPIADSILAVRDFTCRSPGAP